MLGRGSKKCRKKDRREKSKKKKGCPGKVRVGHKRKRRRRRVVTIPSIRQSGYRS